MILDEMAARLAVLCFYETAEEYRGERDALASVYHEALAAQPERSNNGEGE